MGGSGNNNNNTTITNTNTNTISGTNFGNNIFDDNEWDNIFDGGNGDLDDEDGYGNNSNYKSYQNPYSYRDCIVFLIDASKAMFEPNDNNEIPFHNAVKCVIQTITDKIITSESDLIGICFFNTNKKKNINDFENIYVLSDLDIPDPKVILTLEEMIENDFSKQGLGHCEGEFPFCDALWTCSTMFSNMKNSGGSNSGSSGSSSNSNNYKRIFLFTNEDNPNQYNDSIINSSIQRSKDLGELGIQIELFSMNKPGGNKFDFTLFYQHIIIFPDDENYIDPTQFDASSKFSELRSKLKRKEFKKRSLGKIPLYIGNLGNGNGKTATGGAATATSSSSLDSQVIISTQIYNLFSPATKSSPTLLDPKTNLPVKQLIKNVCVNTSATLLPSQIKLCYYYGGEPIIFTKDEMESIKSIDRVGLTLLGFKPIENVKPYHSIKHSQFIFPDELSIKGSTLAFNALVEQMLKSNKAAICRFTPRSSSSPRMVALLPQEEILQSENDSYLNAHSTQSQSSQQQQQQQSSQQQSSQASNYNSKMIQFRPRGMHVIYLPYADDIRYPSNIGLRSDDTGTGSGNKRQENIDKAKNIIKMMKVKFDEKKFVHPGLQKHYASLQALALERDKVEDTVDNIQPDKQLIDSVLDITQEFSDNIFPPGYAATISSSTSSSSSSSKRSRDGKDLSTLDWSSMVKSGEIMKLTVDELKQFLNNQSIKPNSKAKKADLVDYVSKLVLGGKLNQDKLKLLKKDESTTTSPPLFPKTNDEDDDDDRPKKKVRSTTTTTTTTTSNPSSSSSAAVTSRKKPPPKKSFSTKNNKNNEDNEDNEDNNNNNNNNVKKTKSNNNNNNNVDDQFDIDFKNSDDDDEDTDNESMVTSSSATTKTTTTTTTTSQSSDNSKKKNNYIQNGMFDTRKLCQYGKDCYRTNKQHHEEYRHK